MSINIISHFNAEDQTIGLIMSGVGGKVERVRVTRNELPKTTVDV